MKATEADTVEGRVLFEVIRDGVVVNRTISKNATTKLGFEIRAGLLGNVGGKTAPTYLLYGNEVPPPVDNSDRVMLDFLNFEYPANALQRQIASSVTLEDGTETGDTLRLTRSYTIINADQPAGIWIYNAGLADTGTIATGILYAYTLVNSGNGQQLFTQDVLNVTWDIQQT